MKKKYVCLINFKESYKTDEINLIIKTKCDFIHKIINLRKQINLFKWGRKKIQIINDKNI